MNSLDIVERRSIADAHLEACADSLTNPDVTKALGSFADRLIQILDWIYVPNIRNGAYEAPRRFRDGPAIPMVVVARGEGVAYRTDNLVSMHPDQQANLRNALEFWDSYYESIDIESMIDTVNRTARENAGEIKVLDEGYMGDAMARVHPEYAKLDLAGSRYEYLHVTTRPMIVLGAHALVDEGVTLAHESTHVDQFLDEELVYDWHKGNDTRMELGPNHVEYEIIKAKYGGHIPARYWYIERKEKVRILANGTGENAYDVTPKLLKTMMRFGYDGQFGYVGRPPRKVPVTAAKMKNKHGRVGVKVNRR